MPDSTNQSPAGGDAEAREAAAKPWWSPLEGSFARRLAIAYADADPHGSFPWYKLNEHGRNSDTARMHAALDRVLTSTKAEPSRIATDTIVATLQYWIDFNKSERAHEGFETTDDTYIIRPPSWPSHGMLKNWIAHITAMNAEHQSDLESLRERCAKVIGIVEKNRNESAELARGEPKGSSAEFSHLSAVLALDIVLAEIRALPITPHTEEGTR